MKTSKILATGLLGLVSACGDHTINQKEKTLDGEFLKHHAYSLTRELNYLAAYRSDDRMSYDQFVGLTGIPEELPPAVRDFIVLIHVDPTLNRHTVLQNIAITDSGEYVEIDLSLDTADDVLTQLRKKI